MEDTYIVNERINWFSHHFGSAVHCTLHGFTKTVFSEILTGTALDSSEQFQTKKVA